jgi:acyl dehydratase
MGSSKDVVPTDSQTRELDGAPGMLGLFAKAGVAMIPGVSALPGMGGQRAADVSGESLLLPEVRVDRDRLVAYARVCGFTVRETLPATYPHMLAFPLHLQLMTNPKFPFPAIGLVHIYNRITVHRPLRAGETFSIRVWAEPLVDHPRGRAVPIRTEVRVGDELVWEEASTNLRIGKRRETAGAPSVPSAEDLPAVARWRLPGDLGRRYAAVSGDYNPIHVHPLTAKLLGFPTAIAHGMWTQARCLAALEPTLPAGYIVEAAFKRPILLPATVDYAEGDRSEAGVRFGVRDSRKDVPHLDGVVSF